MLSIINQLHCQSAIVKRHLLLEGGKKKKDTSVSGYMIWKQLTAQGL